MANQVRLILSSPHKAHRDEMCARIVIPAFDGDMMILPDRAPSSILLRSGVLQILDKDNKPLEKFFIKGGVADVHEDICGISTDKVINASLIKLENVIAKRDEVAMQEYKEFYQMIIDYMSRGK